jgi:4-carboxymuconolactone decarboxylase
MKPSVSVVIVLSLSRVLSEVCLVFYCCGMRSRRDPIKIRNTIMSKSDLFEKGLEVRKEVLGEDYVNRSIAGADEFTRTMAEWSTEFCWGALWTRPGLDRRTRSIINLAMLGALGKPHELKLHVKGALKNGVTKDEIKEVLLQVAVYCGVPAGIDAFRNAREAFKELDAE